ncbi:MAG: tyrosine-type recombinase/integrase [Cyanobacteria bacterium P01_F01_bin.86]
MANSREIPPVNLSPISGKRPKKASSAATDLRWMGIDEFLKAKSLAPNTEKAYRRELRRFLGWCEKPWSEVNIKDLKKYKSYLIEQGLQASSRNRALASLKSFFGWFAKAYPAEGSQIPTSAVSLEKLPELPPFDLSSDEVDALKEALEYRGNSLERDRALFAVLEHGLRAGEVSQLNIGDYDGIRLEISRAKDDSTGKVPLLPEAREALDTYLDWREQEEELDDKKPLFVTLVPGKPRKRLGYQGIRLVLKELEKLAGIEGLTPHRLRHTFATNLALWGMDGMHARTLTRHKDERSYRRYAKRALQVAAEQAFFRAAGDSGARPEDSVTKPEELD